MRDNALLRKKNERLNAERSRLPDLREDTPEPEDRQPPGKDNLAEVTSPT